MDEAGQSFDWPASSIAELSVVALDTRRAE